MSLSKSITVGSKKKKHKTIGFLINQLHDRYQNMVCPGIIDGAKKRGYNLIAFVGKSLNSPSIYENQENTVYKLANEKNIDGLLIVTGAIGNYLTIDELKDFCDSFKPLPVVCISTPIKGIPSVWVDNYKGMRDIVTHFVKYHNYKRIAFIRGPSNNTEAELRYNIFKEVLSENKVNLFPELIVEGNFVWYSGVEAIKTIIDERKAKFDAMLAANDEMLIGAYRELLSRGIKIPEEVALGGFDNIDETRIITPQITTVNQSIYEKGMKAVELVADLIEGVKVDELYTFSSELIIRESCGCEPVNIYNNIENNIIYSSKYKDQDLSISKAQFNEILEKIYNDIEIRSSTPKEYIKYKDIIKPYLDLFIDDIKNQNNKFIKNIVKLITLSKEEDINLEFYKILITKIYRYISDVIIYSKELLSRVFNLYNSAQSILLDSLSRYNQNKLIQKSDYNLAMLNITKTLSSTFTLESLRDVITRLLPSLNISYCFIALYENHTDSLSIPSFQSSVFLNYNTNNNSYDYNNKQLVETYQLISDIFLNNNKMNKLAVFPLVTENDHFGFIVFDYVHNNNPIMYETLQGHISSSLKASILLETVIKQSENLIKQKDELSKSLAKLRKVMGGFINSMSLLVETRDPYTAGHQVQVANLARAIATEMGLPKDQIEGIRVSGVLHDLGKIYIPSQILNKPGALMDVEISLIKIHPQIGYNILKSVDFPWPVADIILQHHERIDGSGYPYGLKSDQILIEAQIICVADVVEAMASHRPYRPALGIDAALEEISKNKGRFYNADVVDCCIKLFKEKGFSFSDLTGSFKYPHSK